MKPTEQEWKAALAHPATVYVLQAALAASLAAHTERGGKAPTKEAVADKYGMSKELLHEAIKRMTDGHPEGTPYVDMISRVRLKENQRPEVGQVREVFNYWKRATGQLKAVSDHKRTARITARLREGFTVEQLCKAADALAASKWHRGDNPTGSKYLGIEHVYRDAETVERWLSVDASVKESDPIEQARMETMARAKRGGAS